MTINPDQQQIDEIVDVLRNRFGGAAFAEPAPRGRGERVADTPAAVQARFTDAKAATSRGAGAAWEKARALTGRREAQVAAGGVALVGAAAGAVLLRQR